MKIEMLTGPLAEQVRREYFEKHPMPKPQAAKELAEERVGMLEASAEVEANMIARFKAENNIK